MASRKPLTMGTAGLPQQLQAGDALDRTGDVTAASGYIQTPANGTLTLVAKAGLSQTLTDIKGVKTSAGTLTLTVLIGGVAVTGLSAVAVTTTAQDIAATALNALAVGGRLTLTVAAVTGATDLEFTLVGVR